MGEEAHEATGSPLRSGAGVLGCKVLKRRMGEEAHEAMRNRDAGETGNSWQLAAGRRQSERESWRLGEREREKRRMRRRGDTEKRVQRVER